MAYETGTATGITDLLGKLETFIAANGWTVGACTTGKCYYRADTGIYCGVYGDTTNNLILLLGCTGYNSGAAWNLQPGYATTGQGNSNGMSGSFVAYHFFVTSTYVHVVVETAVGYYKHFQFGLLDKAGSYTGGQYYQAVYWDYGTAYCSYPDQTYHLYMWDASAGTNGFGATQRRCAVRADIDGKTNNWMQMYNAFTFSTNYSKGAVRQYGLMHGLIHDNPNQFNGLTPLLPIPVACDRGDSLTSMLGFVSDMRLVNMRNLTPGQVMTIGTDEWLCFPAHRKSDTVPYSGNPEISSGMYGYAYKKVA